MIVCSKRARNIRGLTSTRLIGGGYDVHTDGRHPVASVVGRPGRVRVERHVLTTKPLAVPPHHGIGLHDHVGGALLLPRLGEKDPKRVGPSSGAVGAWSCASTRPAVDEARESRARPPGVRGRSIRSIGGARAAASACVILLCFRAQNQPASPAITYWRTCPSPIAQRSAGWPTTTGTNPTACRRRHDSRSQANISGRKLDPDDGSHSLVECRPATPTSMGFQPDAIGWTQYWRGTPYFLYESRRVPAPRSGAAFRR